VAGRPGVPGVARVRTRPSSLTQAPTAVATAHVGGLPCCAAHQYREHVRPVVQAVRNWASSSASTSDRRSHRTALRHGFVGKVVKE
jgi:hypothetical protein